jgi:nucleotide-binding universal stress UspA family protein
MESTGKSGKGTILVPVDYSENSTLACRYAAKIANKSGNEIVLFHAFYSPAFDLIELTGGLQTQEQLRADVTEKLIESETQDIKRFIDSLFEHAEFKEFSKDKIRYEIKAGLAKDELIATSNEICPDMVVMGTKGSGKKSTSLFGSITEAAILKLKVPVLTVPGEYKFIGEENLRNVVYLTDFDESDFASIRRLMQFTQMFNMGIHCIHIGPRTDKWEMLKMEGLKDYFKNAYHQESVECHILMPDPDLLQSLDKYVQENGINMIALTHKKRNLMEKVFKTSVAKKVFYHSEIPLLVFHS